MLSVARPSTIVLPQNALKPLRGTQKTLNPEPPAPLFSILSACSVPFYVFSVGGQGEDTERDARPSRFVPVLTLFNAIKSASVKSRRNIDGSYGPIGAGFQQAREEVALVNVQLATLSLLLRTFRQKPCEEREQVR